MEGLLARGTRTLAEASNLVGYKNAQQDNTNFNDISYRPMVGRNIMCIQGMKALLDFRAGVTSNTTRRKRI